MTDSFQLDDDTIERDGADDDVTRDDLTDDVERVLEEDLVEEGFLDDDAYTDDEVGRRKKSRLKLFCFNCNRPESFFHANRGKWLHSYFAGLTFGISRWIGPFKCRCCGHRRYLKTDLLHPKMWIKAKK